jgi:predicted anti-sigma-YlaC factor YlaD
MDCSRCRDALSARIDAEDPGVPTDQVDAHLRSCVRCREWLDRAEALDRTVRVRAADRVPDLVPDIVARVGTRATVPWWQPAWPWRVTLAVMGVVQVALGIPAVVIGSSGADHMAHELSAWGVALGAGFLYAAWRPARAAGMLPFVAALVAFLFVTTTRDVLAGNAGLADEVSHLFEAFGLFVLWMVARLARTPDASSWDHGLHPA